MFKCYFSLRIQSISIESNKEQQIEENYLLHPFKIKTHSFATILAYTKET